MLGNRRNCLLEGDAMKICPACGRKPAHTVEQYQYVESGLDNVFVSGVGIYRCECGQEYVQLPDAQKVHDQIASELLNKPSLLTGREAKFLRKWMCLTSEVMANVLGYTRVSASRWEKNGPSVATDRALRLYASVVRSMPIDFENLFSSMKEKPQKDFKITVDGVRTAIQHPTAKATSIITTAKSSPQESQADFKTAVPVADTAIQEANVVLGHAANQELALAA